MTDPRGKGLPARAAGALLLCAATAGPILAGAGSADARKAPHTAGRSAAAVQSPGIGAAYFTREILPVLQKSCLGCHGVGNRLANLDLSSRAAALKGGGRGPSLV